MTGTATLKSLLAGSIGLWILSACSGQVGAGATRTASPTATRTPARLGPTSTASLTPTARARVQPTPTLAPVPTVAPDEPRRGPDQAAVRMILYLDYDCDPCSHLARASDQVQAGHSDEVQLVLRPFPLLEVHDLAGLAAAAVLAAHEQGAFWPMHSLLLDERADWRGMDNAAFSDWLQEAASRLDLDVEAFARAMGSSALSEHVERAYREALGSGIPGAPFLLINRRPYLLSGDPTRLEAAVRLNLLEPRQFSGPPAQVIEPSSTYAARLDLGQDQVQVQLYPRFSPIGVNSFVFLAGEGWYDGTAFHRVIPDQLAEAGDPSLTGLGDAGYHFEIETHPALSFDQPGMVALDNDGPGTNSARFFVTLSASPPLSRNYTIIGKVTEGLDLIQGLEARDPLNDMFEPPQAVIEHVEIASP